MLLSRLHKSCPMLVALQSCEMGHWAAGHQERCVVAAIACLGVRLGPQLVFEQACQASSCKNCETDVTPSRVSVFLPSGCVAGWIEGAIVTELAAEGWSVELVGWESLLDNGEGAGQMGVTNELSWRNSWRPFWTNSMLWELDEPTELPCKWELGLARCMNLNMHGLSVRLARSQSCEQVLAIWECWLCERHIPYSTSM